MAKARLHPRLQHAFDRYQPYRTSETLEKILEEERLEDPDSKHCLAVCLWKDADATEFDEDYVSFGAEAEALLAEILAQEPTHAPSVKLCKKIASRVKKAQKAIDKLAAFEEVPEQELSLDEANEFAYFLSDNRSDPASKRKEHRLWMRLHEEKPDVVTSVDSDLVFIGHKFFYLGHAALALWESGDRKDALPLFDRLLTWPVDDDLREYDNVLSGLYELRLLEDVELDDRAAFDARIQQTKEHFERLNAPLYFANTAADRLLTYAMEEVDHASLRTIVELLFEDRRARSMSKEVRGILAAARETLSGE
jgi:hypothetical protein